MNLKDFKKNFKEMYKTDKQFVIDLLSEEFMINPFPLNKIDNGINLSKSAKISHNSHFQILGESKINVGDNCRIDNFSWLRAWGEGINMKSNCTLNQYSMIQGPVNLGDGVRIGAHTLIIASQHITKDTKIEIYKQGVSWKGITIGDDVWIGSNAVILDGVTIGKGSIIGAGAVVIGEVPEYSVYGGVPARLLKKRP